MRRRVGLAALDRRVQDSQQWQERGNSIRKTHVEELNTQLSVFQAALASFSKTHAADIRSNPQFRAEFARMCNAIGVDPLAVKGNFWAEMLGGNDFYFELAVKVVEVCRDTRDMNGGLIPVKEVKDIILRRDKTTGGGMEISDDDIIRAVKSLSPLGSGFEAINIGKMTLIRSVPQELNKDQSKVLEVIQILGYATTQLLLDNLQWIHPRAQAVLDNLVSESFLWIDTQGKETEYWAPSFYSSSKT